MTYLWLAVGGVIGALGRYHGVRWIQAYSRRTFPLGTMVINISGCLILGSVMGLVAHHPGWPVTQVRLLVGTGFCGAYTTFSSFGFETVQLWRQGARVAGIMNVLGHALAGALAAGLGLMLGLAL